MHVVSTQVFLPVHCSLLDLFAMLKRLNVSADSLQNNLNTAKYSTGLSDNGVLNDDNELDLRIQ